MVFPALFAAGMTLMDTTDGVLMLGAYDWAFADPIRKLRYNLTITSVSVAIALLVGAVETLDLVSDRLRLRGALPAVAAHFDRHLGAVGFGILLLFVIGWFVSVNAPRNSRAAPYPRIDPGSTAADPAGTAPSSGRDRVPDRS